MDDRPVIELAASKDPLLSDSTTHKLRSLRYMIYDSGNFLTIGHRQRQRIEALASQLARCGARVERTSSFIVCRAGVDCRPIVLHTYRHDSIDEDLPEAIARELGGLPDLLGSPEAFGELLFSIIASATLGSSEVELRDVPRDQLGLVPWRYYCRNTVGRLRTLMDQSPQNRTSSSSHVVQFAGIYRWVIANGVGNSYLDVGTSLGFLPILIDRMKPGATVVGCDNRPEVIVCARDAATQLGNDRVRFVIHDVLDPEFQQLGVFDTVVSVHLLEHLAEAEVELALTNMLAVARRRLLVVVPYEQEMQPLYGHQQVFTPERLEVLGHRCVARVPGGHFSVEEVHGGALIVDVMKGEAVVR